MNFRQIKQAVLAAALTAVSLAQAAWAAPLRVVATTPDLADIARRVGGDHVKVDTLARGTEDIHAVPMRPSFVPKLARADAVVSIGLGAEHTFLPGLLEAAANPRILPGKSGYIECSRYVTPADVPATVSRAEGEIHPFGNPHYNIHPAHGPSMVRAVTEGLSELDPAHAEAFRVNAEVFTRELESKIAEWTKAVARLKGTKAVSYHKDMVYFAEFLGIEVIDQIEPKPGIAPTPKRLEEIVGKMKAQGVQLILHEQQYADSPSRWIAAQTGARTAVVGTIGGAFPDSGTYIGMIDHNIRAVLEAVK